MDITFDTITTFNNVGTPALSISGNYTVPANDNDSVVIAFVAWNAGAVSATYGGLTMSFMGLQSNNIAIFLLRNPPTGVQACVVTSTLSATFFINVASYQNVALYGPIGVTALNTNITGGTSVSTSVTPTTDRCWVIGFARSNGTQTPGGSGFTTRSNASNIWVADTNGPIARSTLTTFTSTYTPTGATNQHILLCLRPAVSGAGLI